MRSLASVNGLIVLLAVALGIQVLARGGRDETPLPRGPAPGTPPPNLLVTTLEDARPVRLPELLLEEAGCALLVVISPTCPTCARMRVTWPDRFEAWANSVGNNVRPVWLSEGGGAALRAFTKGFDLDGIRMAYLREGTTGRAYHVLGVLGTPTLYLIDSTGTVRAGLLGDAFPPAQLGRRVCK